MMRMEVKKHDKANTLSNTRTTSSSRAHSHHYQEYMDFEGAPIALPTEFAIMRREGELLSLMPLANVAVLRPSLAHLDEVDEESPSYTRGSGDVNDPKNNVDVRFERAESAAARERRLRSHNFITRKIAEEPEWTLCPLAPERGDESANNDLKATLPDPALATVVSPSLTHALSRTAYRAKIFPVRSSSKHGSAEAGSSSARAQDHMSYISRLKNLDPLDRMMDLLPRVGTISYSQLRRYFTDTDDAAVLAAMEGAAVIVHGVVVVLSALVTQDDRAAVCRRYLLAEMAASPDASLPKTALRGTILDSGSSFATIVLDSVVAHKGPNYVLKERPPLDPSGVVPDPGALLPPAFAAFADDIKAMLVGELEELRLSVKEISTDVAPFIGKDALKDQVNALRLLLDQAIEMGTTDQDALIKLVIDTLISAFGAIGIDGIIRRLRLLPAGRLEADYIDRAKLYSILNMSYHTIAYPNSEPIFVRPIHATSSSQLDTRNEKLRIAVLDAITPESAPPLDDITPEYIHSQLDQNVAPALLERILDEISTRSPETGVRHLKSGQGLPDECAHDSSIIFVAPPIVQKRY